MSNQLFLDVVSTALAEDAHTDFLSVLATIGGICSIAFGLIGAIMAILYFSERKKARDKASGMSEGIIDTRLDTLTSGQAVMNDKLDDIRKTQNSNHLDMCERMVKVETDVANNKNDIDRIGGKVEKIESHLWGKDAKGQYDQSDAPERLIPISSKKGGKKT